MAFTQPEEAFCSLEFAKTKSWTLFNVHLAQNSEKEPPERQSILRWYNKFIMNECLCPAKKTGRPSTLRDTVEQDTMLERV